MYSIVYYVVQYGVTLVHQICAQHHTKQKKTVKRGRVNISAPNYYLVYYVGVTLVHQIRIKRGQFEATNKGAEEQAGKKTVAVMISPKQKILVKCRPKHSIENKCVHYENNH